MEKKQENQFLGQEKIGKLLLKFSVPCITALLIISALYWLWSARFSHLR